MALYSVVLSLGMSACDVRCNIFSGMWVVLDGDVCTCLFMHRPAVSSRRLCLNNSGDAIHVDYNGMRHPRGGPMHICE